jgi:hypothetical protein
MEEDPIKKQIDELKRFLFKTGQVAPSKLPPKYWPEYGVDGRPYLFGPDPEPRIFGEGDWMDLDDD